MLQSSIMAFRGLNTPASHAFLTRNKMIIVTAARLKAILPWLWQARHVWLSILVSGLALIMTWRFRSSEPIIRWTGLGVQLLGGATVIWTIIETRNSFRLPSLYRKAGKWFARFPLLKAGNTVLGGGVASGNMTASAFGHVEYGIPPNATDIERIKLLERNLNRTNRELAATQQQIAEGFAKASKELSEEKSTRQISDESLNEKLAETSTGGLHISAIGALWIIIGSVLSTGSLEISGWLVKLSEWLAR